MNPDVPGHAFGAGWDAAKADTRQQEENQRRQLLEGFGSVITEELQRCFERDLASREEDDSD